MSTGQPGDPAGAGGPANEEELRAAYEAEIKKIRVEQVLLEQVVTLVNLGMRRTGLGPGTEDERDLGQVRLAIDSIRALMPLVEQAAAPQAGPIRDALSQLQLAYVRLGGKPEAGEAPTGAPGAAGPAGPAGPGTPPDGPGAGAERPPGPPSPPAGPGEGAPGEQGPAQRSGRLWIPGQ
ncbi:MAG TPA: hypothetical protein VII87_03985 [Solirubrobacteraceae bacterium]